MGLFLKYSFKNAIWIFQADFSQQIDQHFTIAVGKKSDCRHENEDKKKKPSDRMNYTIYLYIVYLFIYLSSYRSIFVWIYRRKVTCRYILEFNYKPDFMPNKPLPFLCASF